MNWQIRSTSGTKDFALVVLLGGGSQAQGQSAKTPYPSMAPLEEYLIADRTAEIALARSAGTESIARNAEGLEPARNGYESAVKGKSGFLCMAHRSSASAIATAQCC